MREITFVDFHLMKSTLYSLFASIGIACFLTQGNLAAQIPQSAIAAQKVFKQHCYKCHGENGVAVAGLNVMNWKQLTGADGFIVPKDVGESSLYDYMDGGGSYLARCIWEGPFISNRGWTLLVRCGPVWLGRAVTNKPHINTDYPLMLVGGENLGLRHGAVHDFGKKAPPLSNLYLTLLNALNVPATQFSDSSGTISEIMV